MAFCEEFAKCVPFPPSALSPADAFADDHAPLVPLVSFRRVAIKMDSSGNQWETVTFDKRGPGGRVSGQSQKQTLMKAQRAGAVSAQAKCASHRRAARVRIRVR